MKSNLRYALYARKSSEDDDRQVQSIDDQIKWGKKMAASNGLNIVKVYTESRSAKKPENRPQFTQLLQDIEDNQLDGIICWQINRLSRNPVDSGKVQWLLQDNKLLSIRTNEREYLPSDNALLFSVESGMANQYILELRANTMRGVMSKVEKGWMPALAPIGYLNDHYTLKGEKTIKIDQERFPLIQKMFQMMLSGGYSPMQIRDIANNEWALRSRHFKRRGNKPLSRSEVYRIFTNIYYAGYFDYIGRRYKGKHKPMISLDEFDRIQEMLGDKGRPRPQTQHFIYRGFLKCGYCGCSITAERKRKFIKTTGLYKNFVYYRCTHRKESMPCSQRPISEPALEEQIRGVLDSLTIAPEFEQWAIEILNRENDKELELQEKIRKTQNERLLKTQKEMGELTKMRYRSLIDDTEFTEERERLKQEEADLKKEIGHTEERMRRWYGLTEQTFRFAASARTAFEKGDYKTKQQIFSTIGSNRRLIDGKLLFDANKWLIPIQNDYPAIEKKYKEVRTEKAAGLHRDKAALSQIRELWGE